MAALLNVTFHRNTDTECPCLQKPYIFSYPFPKCTPGCDFLNALFSTLPILLKPSVVETLRIRLIMASSFSVIEANDSSLFNLLNRNDAQVSIPTLSITYSRFDLVRFLPAFRTEHLLIVSKKPDKRTVSLRPETLAPPNLRVIGGVLLLWQLLDAVIRRETESYWLCFLTQVYLELLSSHITTLFNQQTPIKPVITRDGEIGELLAAGKYRAVYRTGLIGELFGNYFKQVSIFFCSHQCTSYCSLRPLYSPSDTEEVVGLFCVILRLGVIAVGWCSG